MKLKKVDGGYISGNLRIDRFDQNGNEYFEVQHAKRFPTIEECMEIIYEAYKTEFIVSTELMITSELGEICSTSSTSDSKCLRFLVVE